MDQSNNPPTDQSQQPSVNPAPDSTTPPAVSNPQPAPVAEPAPAATPAPQEPAVQANGDVVVYKREGLKYTIKIDRKACIGATTCTAVAPKTFEMDDQNIAIVKEGTSADMDDTDTILAAAQACPVFAIIIEDEAGNQIYPEKH